MAICTAAYAKAGVLLNLKGTVTPFRLNLTPDRTLDLGTVFLISSFEVPIICYALTLAFAVEIVTDITEPIEDFTADVPRIVNARQTYSLVTFVPVRRLYRR